MADDAPVPVAGKRGRPRVETPKEGAAVSAWLPASDYDRIIKTAKAQDVTISALVRSWLQLKMKS
jgi:hypothetical protein